MSADALHSIYLLLLGFSVAGLLGTGYQLVTARPASFNIFGDGTGAIAVAHVPFLVFAAPFIMVRDAVRVRRSGAENFVAGMIVSMIAGAWSLLSGKVVMHAMTMLGLG
ncbi:MAG: hypothetical protein ABW198_08620 [Pseudorhodoplanes sp.]